MRASTSRTIGWAAPGSRFATSVAATPSMTAAVLAVDEVHLIAGCIASVGWADEVLIVLDDRATASMEAIAAATGARVVRSRFESFQRQRNRALQLAPGD